MPTEIKFGTKTTAETIYYLGPGRSINIGRTLSGRLVVATCLPDDMHSLVEIDGVELPTPWGPVEAISFRHEEAGLGYLEVDHVLDLVGMAEKGI